MRQDIINKVSQSSTQEEITAIVDAHSSSSSGQQPIENLDEINSIFNTNGSVHDLYHNLQNSDSEFARATLKKLQLMSPLSVGVVFEQIKRGAKMDFKSVFEMEYKISMGFLRHTEFFEGIRALLVDKDKSPKWRHSSIPEVKQEEIDWFFNQPDELNLEI